MGYKGRIRHSGTEKLGPSKAPEKSRDLIGSRALQRGRQPNSLSFKIFQSLGLSCLWLNVK